MRIRSSLCLSVVILVAHCSAPRSRAAEPAMRVIKNATSGQFDVFDGDQPVLRYNYQTVEPADQYLAQVHPNNRKYARPRSDYIHPLYGPDGEALTLDLARDHPHHRGIYWAWPEVQFNGRMHDLHALQGVFERPTGRIESRDGGEVAQIVAENQWLWEDKTPIVREIATIRAHRETAAGRYIDLKFEFTALVDGVTIARRGTSHYGGLNIRLSPVQELKLPHYTDPPDAMPRMAWSDSIGIRQGGNTPVGLAVFEKRTNPQYPGQYLEYPNLPWFGPTFPATGTRCALSKTQPLVLEYRLWIRRGGQISDDEYRRQWSIYNTDSKE